MKSPLAWLCCGVTLLGGCNCLNVLDIRSQSPDDTGPQRSDSRLVGEMAAGYGMFPVRVQGVALVTQLKGTGSDPAPSPQRAVLLNEMQTRDVANPSEVLASPGTAMVLIQGYLRPGVQEGDRFDVEVRIPSRSETTSLRGGWLLQTRLKEMAVLDNRVREGHLLALAEGPVLVDPSADANNDRVMRARGRILGGGVALKSRPLGLVLKPRFQNVVNSARVANALNKRFHTFRNGLKVGVAKAKTDEFVELTVHPSYKDNIARYMRLVRAVAVRETQTQRMRRMARLRDQLLDPLTAAEAALQLEAVGPPGAKILGEGIRAADPEVRFYAAEALAYLDRREAAEPLGEAARGQPAFRVFALTALSAMDDYAACEQLQQLLHTPSAETRYGAFRALWAMNPADPLVSGERLGGQFSYHLLQTSGPPMIHVTRSRRPEIVLFGQDQRLLTPLAVNAGNEVMVTSISDDEISVSRFSVNEADQKRTVSTRVDEVIRAIVELGGTYPDVVQALQEAATAGALSSRFEVEALPEAGRKYHRRPGSEQPGPDPEDSGPSPRNPLPELFANQRGNSPAEDGGSGERSKETGPARSKSVRKPHPVTSFFARMVGHGSD